MNTKVMEALILQEMEKALSDAKMQKIDVQNSEKANWPYIYVEFVEDPKVSLEENENIFKFCFVLPGISTIIKALILGDNSRYSDIRATVVEKEPHVYRVLMEASCYEFRPLKENWYE